MVLLTCMFGTAQVALVEFPEERPIFVAEYSTNHYSVVSYFVARLLRDAIIDLAQVFVLVRLGTYICRLVLCVRKTDDFFLARRFSSHISRSNLK